MTNHGGGIYGPDHWTDCPCGCEQMTGDELRKANGTELTPDEERMSMTIRDFLDYEIRSSWWGWMIWWGWGQSLAARYFAWKTKRKYNRYIDSRLDKAMIELMRQCQDEPPNALGNRRAAFGASVLTDGLAGKRTE